MAVLAAASLAGIALRYLPYSRARKLTLNNNGGALAFQVGHDEGSCCVPEGQLACPSRFLRDGRDGVLALPPLRHVVDGPGSSTGQILYIIARLTGATYDGVVRSPRSPRSPSTFQVFTVSERGSSHKVGKVGPCQGRSPPWQMLVLA